MATNEYDLVVLGSGPAGEKGAAQAAYFGKKVALVEKEPVLGGAAANTGTLPSKTLRETAVTLSGFRSRDLYGVDLSLRRDATVQDFLVHERRVKTAERERISQNLDKHKIDLFQGMGSFVDPHTIKIEAKGKDAVLLKADKVLIGTGSSPVQPDLFDFTHEGIWDSDQILNLQFMPKRMAVVGGGVIGSEYACIFAALGVETYLIDGRDRLLGFLDEDLGGALQRSMAGMGVNLVFQERVASCSSKNEKDLEVVLTSGKKLEVDAVLVAAGRQSNTEKLNMDAAGVKLGKRGLIPVNEKYQTEVEHIYAAGDVIGHPALASTSMDQARMAMVHAYNLEYKKHVAPILPYGIYTIPEVSMAGETEQSAAEKGLDFVVGRAYYKDNARGQIIGDTDGLLKLIFSTQDMKVLGVGVVGENASEMVHPALIAMMAEGHSSLFIESCFNYPTLGQMYKYATYDAMGAAAKKKAGSK